MDDIDVLGYHRCDRCGNWTPDRKSCLVCAKALGEALAARVDVEVAGHVVSVGARSGHRKRQNRRGGYRDSTRALNVARAHHRALARLKAVYLPIYDAMVNEELAKMGEKPIRVRIDAMRRLNRVALDNVTSEDRSA